MSPAEQPCIVSIIIKLHGTMYQIPKDRPATMEQMQTCLHRNVRHQTELSKRIKSLDRSSVRLETSPAHELIQDQLQVALTRKRLGNTGCAQY